MQSREKFPNLNLLLLKLGREWLASKQTSIASDVFYKGLTFESVSEKAQ